MDERRKDKRVPMLLDVVWEGRAGKYEASIGDISLGGCYIDTMGQAEIGEVISFKLHLRSGQWIELQGRVVHRFHGTGFGLHFVNLHEEARALLTQLIADS